MQPHCLAPIFFFVATFFAPHVAAAAPPALPPSVMDRGGLFLPGEEPGTVIAAPLVKTEIEAQVSGPVVRYRLRHTFVNGTEAWTEAIYTYPLPDQSAVDRLEMTVGKRRITGEIAEKREAEKRFAEARDSGRKASLVTQHRPNIFQTSLANIAPGEHVTVEIAYQVGLRMVDDAFRLRMPLVVGLRYMPLETVATFAASGWESSDDANRDADAITPPLRPAAAGKGNPVELSVDLDAGFQLDRVESPSHDIEVARDGPGKAKIRLAERSVPADKDFVLRWSPAEGAAPMAGLFTETAAGQRYAMLTVTPGDGDVLPESARKRALVFVVDTSGSMHGASMSQAQAALRLALDRLHPEDTFRIVRFSHVYESFRADALAATPEHITDAKSYVTDLEADGGTEVATALNHALALPRDPNRLTQIVLITDGAVGNETQLFDAIDNDIGDARLFTVGIGSAPNGYLMSRAAAAGRGTFTYIQDPTEVAHQMTALFGKLEKPVLTDIAVRWAGGSGSVEVWPEPVPDLYAGEPIKVLAALPDRVRSATITGSLGKAVWSSTVTLNEGAERPGVAALWGREKIRGLMHAYRRGEDRKEMRGRIVETALKFDLVSRFTSLIAIDPEVSRPASAELAKAEVPANLPDGWSRAHITGEPETRPMPERTRTFDRAQPAFRQALYATQEVPQTATPAPLILALGVAALLIGGWLTRRRSA